MASSPTGAADDAPVVKAGCWFSASGHSVNQIDPTLFTHLYAGFAVVNKTPLEDSVITFPPNNEYIFQTFPESVQPHGNTHAHKVKALLSIGGPDSDETPNISEAIAYQVSDPNRRTTFIKKSIKLARKYNYDGLDLCWLYPSNGAYPNLLADFILFLNEWRLNVNEDKNKPKLLLTATVFHHPVIPSIDGNDFSYPIEALSRNMDWINVLATDFYTPSNSATKTGPVHAWLNPKEEKTCGSHGIGMWTEGSKIETKKLVLSLPFYGYEWTLEKLAEHAFFAPAKQGSKLPIEYRKIKADYLDKHKCPVVDGGEYVAAYLYSGATWIGFDDEQWISTKIKLAVLGMNLRGYFAWDVTADDDNHTLSNAAFNT
ncbi:hypothetical protein F2P56_013643 [Juglans regia]|uniref:GH18 domain-containing protein n=1 Tax=Juglans regia TaxID=51240 RepID=A0A834CYF8_JUGRE|nr:hypothetical protein F2P56_013643 [Juglans regia]